MKNLLITGLLLLTGLTAVAQINMADSTAQVVAYWNKGEKQNYLVRYDKFQMSGADTTRKVSSTCEVEINVVDSTESSYTTEWTYKNFKDSKGKPLTSDLTALAENMKLIIRTDEMGSFTEVLNWEEISDLQREATALQKARIKEKPELEEAMDDVLAKVSTKEAIEALSIQDVQVFHSFHGGVYKLGETIESELQVPNVYGKEMLDCRVTVSLDEINEEDNYSTLSVLQQIDREQLVQTTLDLLTSAAKVSGEEPPTREDLNDLTHEISVSSSIDGSGWVIYCVQRKTIQSKGETTIEERSMELL